MTNEEAREILQQIRKQKCVSECDYSCPLYESKTFCLEEEALDLAIKALEAQPCIEDYPTCTECEHYDSEKHYCPRFCQVIKDTLAEAQPSEGCISREEAKQFLYERIDRLNDDELYDIFSRIIDDMYNELPSVTPQRPKGKWIEIPVENDIVPIVFKCSECGMRVVNPYKYCPNCGAEMSGGGEDEDCD